MLRTASRLLPSRSSGDGRLHRRIPKRRVSALREMPVGLSHGNTRKQHKARAAKPESTSPICEKTFFPPITFVDLACRSRSIATPPKLVVQQTLRGRAPTEARSSRPPAAKSTARTSTLRKVWQKNPRKNVGAKIGAKDRHLQPTTQTYASRDTRDVHDARDVRDVHDVRDVREYHGALHVTQSRCHAADTE